MDTSKKLAVPGRLRPASAISLVAAFAFAMLSSCAADGAAAVATDTVCSDATGNYVVVLHPGCPRGVADRILEAMGREGPRILKDLGVEARGPYTIHVRATAAEFLKVQKRLTGGEYPGSTGYISGIARAEILVCGEEAQIAVHEYAHSVSLAYAPRWFNRPRWLWEALAAYEAEEFYHPRALPYLYAGLFPTLAELGEDYNESDQKIYRVGYLLYEYILRTWGFEAVKALIRNGGGIEKALGVSRPEFEEGWRRFVTRRYLHDRGAKAREG